MPSSLDKSNEFFSTLEGFNYTGTIQASFGSCEAVRFSSFINVVNAVIQCLGSAYFSAYVIRCSLIFIFFLFIYFIFMVFSMDPVVWYYKDDDHDDDVVVDDDDDDDDLLDQNVTVGLKPRNN